MNLIPFQESSETAIAKKIAFSAHSPQLDLSNAPYINHIKDVVNRVYLYHRPSMVAHGTLNQELFQVAFLHDLLEDCPQWNEAALRNIFDKSVVDAVVLLTKKPEQTYEQYIQSLESNSFACVVKIADLESNMQFHRLISVDRKDEERMIKYHDAYNYLYSPFSAIKDELL